MLRVNKITLEQRFRAKFKNVALMLFFCYLTFYDDLLAGYDTTFEGEKSQETRHFSCEIDAESQQKYQR